jgi:long-subunit fatty acid transport protein
LVGLPVIYTPKHWKNFSLTCLVGWLYETNAVKNNPRFYELKTNNTVACSFGIEYSFEKKHHRE